MVVTTPFKNQEHSIIPPVRHVPAFSEIAPFLEPMLQTIFTPLVVPRTSLVLSGQLSVVLNSLALCGLALWQLGFCGRNIK